MKQQIHEILIRPLLTEKAVAMSQSDNVYAFVVAESANKIEIRKAVEQAFKVKVVKVRTARTAGEMKRYGARKIKRPDVRRAYVTLAEGDRIDIL